VAILGGSDTAGVFNDTQSRTKGYMTFILAFSAITNGVVSTVPTFYAIPFFFSNENSIAIWRIYALSNEKSPNRIMITQPERVYHVIFLLFYFLVFSCTHHDGLWTDLTLD
jgi:hypothetical protein